MNRKMPDITGKRFTTITAAADSVYTVTLSAGDRTIDIVNNTDNDIYIAETNSFTESVSGSAYLTIPPSGGYNGLRPKKDKLYIKTLGSGTISFAVRRI